MKETSLHADLKQWYALPGDLFEARVDRFVVDIIRGDLLIEIQTSNFSAIKHKLVHLLEHHPVRLVYPLPQEKWIIRQSAIDGSRLSRRRSPKRGRIEHLFYELVRIPGLALSSNFSLEVLFTREEEIRRNDGLGSWRRGGWSIADHRLVGVIDRRLFASPQDYQALLPGDLPRPFTNQDLANRLGIPLPLARRMTYCLTRMGLFRPPEKRGRSLLFSDYATIRET